MSGRPGAAGGDHLGSLHELVGAGGSRVSIVGAMRARDVCRPTAAQLADAEQRAAGILLARLAGRPRWRPPAPEEPAPRTRRAPMSQPDPVSQRDPVTRPEPPQLGSAGSSRVRS